MSCKAAFLVALLLVGYATADGSYTYTCAENCAIEDNTVQEHYLSVADPGTVQDLNVELVLDHTFVGDLVIYLYGPTGSRVLLAADECGGTNDIDVTFNDNGEDSFCFLTPVGDTLPHTPLANFIGQPIGGIYTLVVEDNAGADQGELISFTLVFGPKEPSNFPLPAGPPHFFGPSLGASWYMYLPGCVRITFASAVEEMDLFLVNGDEESSILLGTISGEASQSFEIDFSPRRVHPGEVFIVGESDMGTVFSQTFSLSANSAFEFNPSSCAGFPVPDDSCFGRCGEQTPSGCFCDTLCDQFNDCCPDRCQCGGCSTDSCAGRCGAPGDNLSCGCDPGCEFSELGCCSDLCDACPGFCSPGSCEGNCGTGPFGFDNCYCDDICIDAGDCCFDACLECGECEGGAEVEVF